MAVDVLNYISKDKLERMKYEDALLAEIDYQSDLDDVAREADEKARFEMAREMLLDGEPLNKIVKYTKLSAEEVEQLQKGK